MYVSLSVFISVFSLNASIGFHQYCHWLFVYSVVPWFVFLSMFVSVSVNACICPSLYPFFSLFVFECVFHSLDSWYICTSLDLCFCFSFSLFIFVVGYIGTDCTYIGMSLILRFYLSFPLCFWVSGYIIDNLRVCEQARSGYSVCNSSLENLCVITNSACIDSHFYLPLWLWRSVPVSGCVITDCMCVYVSW